MRMMRYLAVSIVAVLLLAVCVFADGGLECVNETPEPTGASGGWVELVPELGSLGLAAPVETPSAALPQSHSLKVAFGICNGDVRVSFAAGGAFPGGKPLTFVHNSRDGRSYRCGVGRTHSYNSVLLEHPSEWHFTSARIVLPTGYRLDFDENLDGTLRGQPGVRSKLVRNDAGGYTLLTDDQPDMVDKGSVAYGFAEPDAGGKSLLTSVVNGGSVVTLTHIASGPAAAEVERVRDVASGQDAVFAYDAAGRLASVTSIDGVATSFIYNSSGDMSEAHSAWGSLTFGYDSHHNITAITDGSGGHSYAVRYGNSARGIEFRDTYGQYFDFAYTVDATDHVLMTSFGPRGQAPTVCEVCGLKLVTSCSVPGQPKVTYLHTMDKRLLAKRTVSQ